MKPNCASVDNRSASNISKLLQSRAARRLLNTCKYQQLVTNPCIAIGYAAQQQCTSRRRKSDPLATAALGPILEKSPDGDIQSRETFTRYDCAVLRFACRHDYRIPKRAG